MDVRAEQTFQQGFDIQSRTTADNGNLALGIKTLNDRSSLLFKGSRIVCLIRINEINKMVPDLGKLFSRRFGSSDVEVFVYLPRIGRNDLCIKYLSQFQRQSGFSCGSGTLNYNYRNQTILLKRFSNSCKVILIIRGLPWGQK